MLITKKIAFPRIASLIICVVIAAALSISSVITAFAEQSGSQLTITFDATGGVIGIDKIVVKSVNVGDKIGKLPQAKYDGYIFDAWYTEKTGGVKVTRKDTIEKDATFYAHWIPKQYQIKFKANGGSVSIKSRKFNFGEAYGELPVPEKSKYLFLGWYTDINDGKRISESTICSISKTTTLYAHWKIAPPPETVLTTEVFKNKQPGDIVAFGMYGYHEDIPDFMSTSNLVVEWIVLRNDGDKVLVVTRDNKYGAAGFFDEYDKAVTWETSSVREFLNKNIIDSFSDNVKDNIVESIVPNTGNSAMNVPGGNETNDKLFLLSIEEVEQYLPVKYRKTQNDTKNPYGFGYWLRSPGLFDSGAAFVYNNGEIDAGGVGATTTMMLRPACYIKIAD